MNLVLRAERWDRWVSSAFSLLWLLVWAGVLLFLSRELREPALHASGLLIPFVLFLAAWALAGLSSLAELVRLHLGTDRIETSAKGVRVRRAVGALGFTREVPRDSIEGFAIAGRAHALEVRTGGKRIVLATLGTVEQRREILDSLRREFARPAEEGLPAGWTSSKTAEGTLVLVAPAGGPRRTLELAPNALTIARPLGPWQRRRTFRDASLQLMHDPRSRYGDWYQLEVRKGPDWMPLAEGTNMPEGLQQLARFVARQTGWRLESYRNDGPVHLGRARGD
jgi:hypothetical protein